MDCNCRCKELYHNFENQTCKIDGKIVSQGRQFKKQQQVYSNSEVIKSMFETSQIYLPTHIQRIDVQQLYANPLWFYKHFISVNKPCIIRNAIETDIIQAWSDPHNFRQLTKNLGDVSVSITPDGFADSIKNQYFVQPLQIKASISDVIDWGSENSKQEQNIRPEWIPYIQHQNSNLTEQCQELTKYLDDQFKDFASLHFFEGKQPDASNFWMGFQNSVSALHKDPYENFYTTITGEKHFTLIPPISICYLQQSTFKSSKYFINPELKQLQITTKPASISGNQNVQLPYETTRWISLNPDLKQDLIHFPQLETLRPYQQHVIMEAGETLYLPSLWYHQVGQTHQHSYATIAINYWFDMEFGHCYNLYETARKLKGYP